MGGGNKRIQANCDAAFLCPSPGQDEGKRMKDLEASLSYIVGLSGEGGARETLRTGTGKTEIKNTMNGSNIHREAYLCLFKIHI